MTPPTGCTISNYAILKNGSSIGTSSGTTFAVSGLSPSTTYSFTVEAMDANGASSPSSAVNVTTLSGGGGGSCATAWSSTQVYTAGMTASESGENYVANYWTQNNNPATNNGGAGSGEPWTATGACSTCSVRASGSDWTRCFRHNQFQHEPWLVGGHSTGRMHGEL